MAYSHEALVTLRAYLDANSGTYGGLDDQQAAETIRAATVQRTKASLRGFELWSVTDGTDFIALTDAQQARWIALCAIDEVDPADNTPAHAVATALFAGSDTLTDLGTLRTETVSLAASQGISEPRAEDVRRARLLP